MRPFLLLGDNIIPGTIAAKAAMGGVFMLVLVEIVTAYVFKNVRSAADDRTHPIPRRTRLLLLWLVSLCCLLAALVISLLRIASA